MKYELKHLSEFAHILVGFAFKSEGFNVEGKGIKLVRGKNITRLSLRWGSDARWWDDFSIDLKRYLLKANDIVIGMDGSLVGKNYARVNEGDLPLLLVQRVACIRARENVDQNFLWNCISSSGFERYIDSVKTGTSIPHISGKQIGEYLIPNFPYEDQKKIGAILSALDDKIELNQKINENLERQMQLLYQKLLTENDCTLVRLQELASKIAMGPFGANIKVSTFVPSGVPIISGNHLRSFFLEEPSYNYITEEHAQRLKNSMVFPKDIIFTHAGNIGQVAMIPEGCDYPYYMISQRQFYMRCDESKVIPEIVLFFFHSTEGKGKLLANANSTGVPSIAQPSTHLKNIEMPLPAKEAQDKWYDVVRPMVRCYVSLCQENKRLIKIRDSLLPQLMFGKIDVSSISI